MRPLKWQKLCLAWLLWRAIAPISECRAEGLSVTNSFLVFSALQDDDGKYYDYSIPWNCYPLKANWRPNEKTFPVDLWKAQKQAGLRLASQKHITDPLEIYGVSLYRTMAVEPH